MDDQELKTSLMRDNLKYKKALLEIRKKFITWTLQNPTHREFAESLSDIVEKALDPEE